MYKFEISPRNTERVISKLSTKYTIFDVTKSEEKVTFCCHDKDRKNILKTLKFMGLDKTAYKAVKMTGIFKPFCSVGIVLGLVVSAVLWIVSSFFITDVIVMGDIDFTEQKIYETLKQNNIQNLMFKSSVDIKKLENAIESIDYVSYVSIVIRGNALIINVREQLTNSEIVNSGNFAPLVSVYDGMITSIKLIQGTLAVGVGDIVKVGDILVYPYSTDSNGDTRSVQPLADVVADVYITSSLTVYDQRIEKSYTGNVIKNYQISFLGLPLYSVENEVSYEHYDVESKEVYISDTLLPIKIKYDEYHEYTESYIDTNFAENEQIYAMQTREIALLNVKNYDIIKNESYVVRDFDGYHVIEFTITASKKIA